MDFRVVSDDSADGNVLSVHGDLDVATAPLLVDAVERELATSPSTLVVDLTPTTFADSTAFRAIAQAATTTGNAGVPMRIVCPVGNRAVRRVFDLLGMDSLVPVTESLNDADEASPAPRLTDGSAPG